jgi:predicted ATPase/two-component sensor histidine kinase
MNIDTSNLQVELENSFGYEIGETLQANSQRIIYRGRRKGDPTLVSLKKTVNSSPSLEEIVTLQNEYQIAKNLKISGIIKPCKLERHQTIYFTILENIEGEFLDRWLARGTPNLVESLQVLISLAQVVGEIHQAGITHKNINPSNITIDPETLTVKILDFSLATRLAREIPTMAGALALEKAKITLPENLVYISPEQSGCMNRALDYRSDFYALGVIFYQMLAGDVPLHIDSVTELARAYLSSESIIPKNWNLDIPPPVSAIATKLLSKNAEDRYQSTYGLIYDLETCLDKLNTTETIEEFTLGQFDRASQLLISQKLYGRESEIATLLSIVVRVSEGETAMVAITGYSGIGKTSLVNEIQKSLFVKQGCLIAGKFDQLKRNIPYAALIEAFGDLIKKLLAQTPEQIAEWRKSILSSLGSNGKVITDIIPELEAIIGIQPELTVLKPIEVRNRFDRVFKDFIGVFAQPEHSLVIFLDDLQWADSASLRAIELLLSDLSSQYLLVIGAYRDNEVNPIHPLIQTLEKIEAVRRVNYINLQPLQFPDINQLIADSLDCELHFSKSLAELVFRKTGGNPFFTERLLQTLYAENLLVFDLDSNSNCFWCWSIDKILAVGITDYDAVELVARNLQQLPEKTQQILQLAACIGNHFDLEILAIVNQKSQLETANELWEALQTGAVLPQSDSYKIPLILDETEAHSIDLDSLQISYKFLHDRVQQAAYSLIPETNRQYIHLKLGYLLLKQTTEEQLEERIFDIVNQLNVRWQAIFNREEKLNLAQLNLIAGKKAKLATAYHIAIRYLNIGVKLLPESSWWETHYDLIFNLYVEAVQTEYLNSNFDRAETLAKIVLPQAKTFLETVKVYETKIQYYIAQSQMSEAIDLALSILKRLNINLPKSPNQLNVIIGLLKTKFAQGRKPTEALVSLPEMKDPEKLAAMAILEATIPAAFVAKPQLFPLIIFKMVDFSLKYGNTSLSIISYAGYGIIHCAILGDIKTGYRYGKLGLTLQEQLDAKKDKAHIYMVFNTFIRHWQDHLKHSVEPLAQGFQSGLETNSIDDACYCATHYCGYFFLIGEFLTVVEEKQSQYIDSIVQHKHKVEEEHTKVWHQAVLNLLGCSANPCLLAENQVEEDKILLSLIESQNNQAVFSSYLVKSFLGYLFKNYDLALSNACLAQKYAASLLSTAYIPLHKFYYSLALLAVYPNVSPAEQKQYLKQVKSHQRQMKKWAINAPCNYAHKYELVEAEIARVLGQEELAAKYYDRAIETSGKVSYYHEQALALELAAEFYFKTNKPRIAQVYLVDAYGSYICWGAVAKVRDLEAKYPSILPPNKHQEAIYQAINFAELDLAAVIKASQAISSEIVLEQLLYKVMNILMQNAGAQRGICLLKEKDSWIVAAEAIARSEQRQDREISLSQVSIDGNLELPNNIINYIQNTKEIVILDKAYDRGLFTKDPYIAEHKVQSVMAAPLLYKNKLHGIIYLENRLTADIFTDKKLEVLKILITQVAISIENSRLYEDRDSVKKSLQEKEILLKEIHHRVKNNLLVVSSLLEFQTDHIQDPEILKMIANSQNRISSMALIHEHLYGTSDLETINFNTYIRALVENLSYSHAAEEKGILITLDVEPLWLNIETANPCGLITNELISNCLEHAFVNRPFGNIWVNFNTNESQHIVLSVRDNGVGCGEDLDFYNTDSLGLKLVATLVEQLKGTIEIQHNNGTSIVITFKELEYGSRV